MPDSLFTHLRDRVRDQFSDRSTPEPTPEPGAAVEPFAAPVPPEAVERARETAVYDETADGEPSLVRLLDGLHRWTQRNRAALGRWLTAATAADGTLVTPVSVDDDVVTVVFPAERWRELKPTLNVTDEQLAAMVRAHRAAVDCRDLGAAASIVTVLSVELPGAVVGDILAAADHEDTVVEVMPDTSESPSPDDPVDSPPPTEDEASLDELLADGPFT
ncbi:hypothetical protein [Halosegnis longus]|uniref:Uncharacterized protein n=1 Tax=Halosegnis longus TaxID=2216012 RepID=A0AAJ4R9J2_9EURY|nr:hypothetical protein [Halosegnis longus]RNJ26809.1 hypothetical protein Nmn1133_09040 [Salella cibi]